MLLKRTLSSIVIGVMLTGLVQPAFALETNAPIPIDDCDNSQYEYTPEPEGIEDLGVQLNDMYHEVGSSLNIDYVYVKIIHLLAGGKAVYADKRPNIKSELTVDNVKAPFEIEGATQNWNISAS